MKKDIQNGKLLLKKSNEYGREFFFLVALLTSHIVLSCNKNGPKNEKGVDEELIHILAFNCCV